MAIRKFRIIDGKVTEVFPEKKKPRKGPYFNMGNKWSRTTQVEFRERNMDEYMKENKK